MTTDSQSQSSILSHLRHELRTPINAIIGYSEMLMEEIAEINQNIDYLSELEQIRDCGTQLLASINNFLNPSLSGNSSINLQEIVTNPILKTELEKLTQLVIGHCQQLISLVEPDYISDLEKIKTAANKLLGEIDNLVKISPHPEDIYYSEVTDNASPEIDTIMDTANLLAMKLEQPLKTDNYTILIVDDSVSNRELLSRQVEIQGYQVATAADGKQAIAMIQTGAYDLILLDIIMPEINGYQVLKWIRASPWRHIPTIMISALDEIDSVVKCIEMGAADYLAKPFNPTLLKARLGA
ncbi:MAG: response regulator, partial [Waterburya sp.]